MDTASAGRGGCDVLCTVLDDDAAGETLAALLERGHVPPDRLRAMVDDVAEQLAALHAAGVVHGAVHPETVLARPDGGAVLLDAAIARGVRHPSPPRHAKGMRAPAPHDDLAALEHLRSVVEAAAEHEPGPAAVVPRSARLRRRVAAVAAGVAGLGLGTAVLSVAVVPVDGTEAPDRIVVPAAPLDPSPVRPAGSPSARSATAPPAAPRRAEGAAATRAPSSARSSPVSAAGGGAAAEPSTRAGPSSSGPTRTAEPTTSAPAPAPSAPPPSSTSEPTPAPTSAPAPPTTPPPPSPAPSPPSAPTPTPTPPEPSPAPSEPTPGPTASTSPSDAPSGQPAA